MLTLLVLLSSPTVCLSVFSFFFFSFLIFPLLSLSSFPSLAFQFARVNRHADYDDDGGGGVLVCGVCVLRLCCVVYFFVVDVLVTTPFKTRQAKE